MNPNSHTRTQTIYTSAMCNTHDTKRTKDNRDKSPFSFSLSSVKVSEVWCCFATLLIPSCCVKFFDPELMYTNVTTIDAISFGSQHVIVSNMHSLIIAMCMSMDVFYVCVCMCVCECIFGNIRSISFYLTSDDKYKWAEISPEKKRAHIFKGWSERFCLWNNRTQNHRKQSVRDGNNHDKASFASHFMVKFLPYLSLCCVVSRFGQKTTKKYPKISGRSERVREPAPAHTHIIF